MEAPSTGDEVEIGRPETSMGSLGAGPSARAFLTVGQGSFRIPSWTELQSLNLDGRGRLLRHVIFQRAPRRCGPPYVHCKGIGGDDTNVSLLLLARGTAAAQECFGAGLRSEPLGGQRFDDG